MSEYKDIRLDDLEQKIFDNFTVLESSTYADPQQHIPMFKSGVQSFWICRESYEDIDHANWMRQMFSKALARMVRTLPDAITD